MTLFDHPLWPRIAPHAHVTHSKGRFRLDFKLPLKLRAKAMAIETNCVSCGKPVKPLRARILSTRSRIAGWAGIEHRLFYGPNCPSDVDAGCSRTKEAKTHKEQMLERFGSLAAKKAPATHCTKCGHPLKPAVTAKSAFAVSTSLWRARRLR